MSWVCADLFFRSCDFLWELIIENRIDIRCLWRIHILHLIFSQSTVYSLNPFPMSLDFYLFCFQFLLFCHLSLFPCLLLLYSPSFHNIFQVVSRINLLFIIFSGLWHLMIFVVILSHVNPIIRMAWFLPHSSLIYLTRYLVNQLFFPLMRYSWFI